MSPRLLDLKVQLDALMVETDPLDAVYSAEQQQALDEAARNFIGTGPELIAEATGYLWEYYRATIAEFTSEQRAANGIPLLPETTDIWTQVSFSHAPSMELGDPPLAPARVYVSFEGEVSWEPEHGLQLVLEEGRRVCKVGPYDGHVTNARAFGDPSLLGVIFK